MKTIREHKYISCLVLMIVGMLLTWISEEHNDSNLYLCLKEFGLALMAGSAATLTTIFFLENTEHEVEQWKLTKIYAKRSEKNKDSDPQLGKVKKQIDVVAFGLKNFRENYDLKVKEAVARGVKFRIITMSPNSKFVNQRDKEENKSNNSTKKSIEDLVKWADEINSHNKKSCIIIKGYDCMTLDFYWRVDDELYIGPYWLGKESQNTVTYKFENGGKGFELYSQYFEQLWENSEFETLTEFKD